MRGRGAAIVGTSGDLPSAASEKGPEKVPKPRGNSVLLAETRGESVNSGIYGAELDGELHFDGELHDCMRRAVAVPSRRWLVASLSRLVWNLRGWRRAGGAPPNSGWLAEVQRLLLVDLVPDLDLDRVHLQGATSSLKKSHFLTKSDLTSQPPLKVALGRVEWPGGSAGGAYHNSVVIFSRKKRPFFYFRSTQLLGASLVGPPSERLRLRHALVYFSHLVWMFR